MTAIPTNLDKYVTALKLHKSMMESLGEVTKIPEPIARTYDSSHRVHFQFIKQSHYWMDERLADFLAAACGEQMTNLISRAVELSLADVEAKAKNAGAEAIETIQNMTPDMNKIRESVTLFLSGSLLKGKGNEVQATNSK